MVLLVLFIFVAGTSTCYGAIDQTDLVSSNLRFMPHVVAAAAASSRLLRSTAAKMNEASTDDQGKEERAQLRRISALTEKLAYKVALILKVNPEVCFTRIRFSESVEKLDRNSEFLAWLRYMLQFRAKTGEDLFSNVKFLRLLREAKPDEEVLELLQSLRRVDGMKTLVDEMQAHLVKIYPFMMNEVWLKFRESPKEIYSFLHTNGLQDTNLIQWLRYTEMYMAKFGPSSFSVSKRMIFCWSTFHSRVWLNVSNQSRKSQIWKSSLKACRFRCFRNCTSIRVQTLLEGFGWVHRCFRRVIRCTAR
ncbi:hypothetical protein PI124_g10547 [Phytophthora idaei]|nr:hypothetical protein PI124_g10547 [Phytophthora idaei]